MARPRKPTKVLELNGAFERNPQRRKAREGEPDMPLGVGEPPRHFDAAQVECWNEIAAEGSAWFTRAARFLLEQAAELLATSRREGLDTSDGKRYDKLLSDLGMGPVAITKVKALPKPNEKKTLIA